MCVDLWNVIIASFRLFWCIYFPPFFQWVKAVLLVMFVQILEFQKMARGWAQPSSKFRFDRSQSLIVKSSILTTPKSALDIGNLMTSTGIIIVWVSDMWKPHCHKSSNHCADVRIRILVQFMCILVLVHVVLFRFLNQNSLFFCKNNTFSNHKDWEKKEIFFYWSLSHPVLDFQNMPVQHAWLTMSAVTD